MKIKTEEDNMDNNNSDKLIVLWTSGNKEVAVNMVFLYTFNAKKKGWWKEITLIIWGASTRLLSEDKELQDYITRIKDAGVQIEACKVCSDNYGVSDQLEKLGIEVKLMGLPLTEYLKKGNKVITI